MTAETKRFEGIEERLDRLELGSRARGDRHLLKWAGSIRCGNLVLSLAADCSGESIGDIASPKTRRPLIVARAAAAFVMTEYGDLGQVDTGKVLGGRDHATISNLKTKHFEKSEVLDLADKILESYKKHHDPAWGTR